MTDEHLPDDEEPDGPSNPADAEPEDSDFGIDLGRRGDRAEQTSRDEVDVPPAKVKKPAARTLTDRLASAASDREDVANRTEGADPVED